MTKMSREIQGVTVEWLGHGSVGIYGEKVVYLDPFGEVLKGDERTADVILSTHAHRDHFDVEAINRLSGPRTLVVIKTGSEKEGLTAERIMEMEVGEMQQVDGLEIKAVHAYNIKRFRSPGVSFHPVGFGMGVCLSMDGLRFYLAGDTDFIEPMAELRSEKIDIAFLPIGGKYTMDVEEAVEAVDAIRPRIVVPVHYNYIQGTEADVGQFKAAVDRIGGVGTWFC